jgi:exodeoxyribonuclease-3
MLVASWNVNSIRARLDRVVAWLAEKQPDVVCLQELKVAEKALPGEAFEAAGYKWVAACQKTYNGVAILAKTPIEDVACGLDDGEEDGQARLISGTVGGLRILSAYAPNGQSVGSDKWAYKLRWLERLRRHLDGHYHKSARLVVAGDFNVAPEARDVHDPAEWEPSVLFHPEARAALAAVRGFGLSDTFRQHHGGPGFYSWWDYRMLGFPKNRGLRIDHVFITETVRCSDAWIDREARKGQQPSDHAPVLATVG